MSQLTIAPVEWSKLRDIDDIVPLNEEDEECLREVRDVLKKYGMLNRFGVALLHSHFDVADDEILLEVSDHDGRTLTTQPVKEDEAPREIAGTIWQLGNDDITAMGQKFCKKYCYTTTFGRHTWHHRRVDG